jgi:ubiquinone/menaquinone biosynthesis C-methylase UbiE
VLDVAAGAEGQTLAAARRVGTAGHVLATDLSPAILEYAAAAARRAGLENVETLELDGETIAGIEDESLDAVISRLGIIYFPDQLGALAEMRRVLRPGGRLAAVVCGQGPRTAGSSRWRSGSSAAGPSWHRRYQVSRTVQPRQRRRPRCRVQAAGL